MHNLARNKNNHKNPLFTTQRKVKRNHTELSKGVKGSAGDITNHFPVLSLPNGTFKSRRPLTNSENFNSEKYYLEKTKRLKHKADAMTNKAGNAFQYSAEIALLLTKYGIALKLDVLESKSVYRVFSDTIVLIKFITAFKLFADTTVSSQGKIFAMLWNVLPVHFSNGHVWLHYSRLLNDRFKSNSTVKQVPSPDAAKNRLAFFSLSNTLFCWFCEFWAVIKYQQQHWQEWYCLEGLYFCIYLSSYHFDYLVSGCFADNHKLRNCSYHLFWI